MGWRRVFAFAVQVVPDAVDAFGDPVEGGPVRTIEGVVDWPLDSAEASSAVVELGVRRALSLPRGASPIANDQIVIYPDGSRWAVVGDAYPWRRGPVVTIERRS